MKHRLSVPGIAEIEQNKLSAAHLKPEEVEEDCQQKQRYCCGKRYGDGV